MKRCPTCKETKPFADFYKHKGFPNEVHTYCKVCERKRSQDRRSTRSDLIKANVIWSRYHINEVEFGSLMAMGCVICGTMDSLCVDHDHACCPGSKSCGKCVRGALCRRHNVALGMFKDSLDELMSAVNYLAKTEDRYYE